MLQSFHQGTSLFGIEPTVVLQDVSASGAPTLPHRAKTGICWSRPAPVSSENTENNYSVLLLFFCPEYSVHHVDTNRLTATWTCTWYFILYCICIS